MKKLQVKMVSKLVCSPLLYIYVTVRGRVEGVKLTGVLSVDLAALCEYQHLPPIYVRPLHPKYVPTDNRYSLCLHMTLKLISTVLHVLADIFRSFHENVLLFLFC